MVFAVLGATFLMSSSSMTTYLSFSYSYPFTSSAARDGLVFRLAVEHLFDTRVVMFVELVETDGLAASGAIQFDGQRHQTKGQVTFPHGGSHKKSSSKTGRN